MILHMVYHFYVSIERIALRWFLHSSSHSVSHILFSIIQIFLLSVTVTFSWDYLAWLFRLSLLYPRTFLCFVLVHGCRWTEYRYVFAWWWFMVRQDDTLTVVLGVALVHDIWKFKLIIVFWANLVRMDFFVHFTISCIHLHPNTMLVFEECPVAKAVMSCMSLVIWLHNVFQIWV